MQGLHAYGTACICKQNRLHPAQGLRVSGAAYMQNRPRPAQGLRVLGAAYMQNPLRSVQGLCVSAHAETAGLPRHALRRKDEQDLMNPFQAAFAEVGAAVPRILLPRPGTDLHRFSVIACDQFTSAPRYWETVEDIVGDAPSALRLMLPEIWLSQDNGGQIARINRTMRQYLGDRTLVEIGESLVFLRRRTSTGVRRGLLVALDLEQYDYRAGAKTMIRATEGTVVDRLPPRVEIRRGAPLEMPHVMVLIDDRENRLMDTLDARRSSLECLYDFSLMQGGGHLTGYRVDDPRLLLEVAEQLSALREQGDGFLYAMGDGNHSFAAAKACWEELKPSLTPAERERHPARWAMAELVSLHDPALAIEPIHRVLYGVDPAAVQREIGFDAACPPDAQVLQPMLDRWLAEHPEAGIDYVHGAEECRRAAQEASDRLAVVFPPFDRSSLFEVVREKGAFVRKSFSLGEGRDKRYYLECRRISPDGGEI